MPGCPWDLRRRFRLLLKAEHAIAFINLHDTQGAGRFMAGHRYAAHGHVGIALHVVGDHGAVVHFVDVISGQYDHVIRGYGTNDVQVLENGICGALVPVVRCALLRGQYFHELIGFFAVVGPAGDQVTYE